MLKQELERKTLFPFLMKRAFALEYISAVCTVSALALRTTQLIHILVIVIARTVCFPDHYLPVAVFVSRRG